MARNNIELAIQYEVVRQLKELQKEHQFLFTAVINEAGGSARDTVKLLKQGMMPGWSDLQLFHPSGKILLLELKAKAGKQSPAQVQFQESVAVYPYIQYTCTYSLQEAMDCVRAWLRVDGDYKNLGNFLEK